MASRTPAPRSNRAAAPAKRGTGAFEMANSAREIVIGRPVVVEVHESGPSKQVPLQLPAHGISGPVNHFGVLPDNVSGDDDYEAAAAAGAAVEGAAA